MGYLTVDGELPLPVYVRDEDLNLVATVTVGESVELPAGTYLVSVPRPGQPELRAVAVVREQGSTHLAVGDSDDGLRLPVTTSSSYLDVGARSWLPGWRITVLGSAVQARPEVHPVGRGAVRVTTYGARAVVMISHRRILRPARYVLIAVPEGLPGVIVDRAGAGAAPDDPELLAVTHLIEQGDLIAARHLLRANDSILRHPLGRSMFGFLSIRLGSLDEARELAYPGEETSADAVALTVALTHAADEQFSDRLPVPSALRHGPPALSYGASSVLSAAAHGNMQRDPLDAGLLRVLARLTRRADLSRVLLTVVTDDADESLRLMVRLGYAQPDVLWPPTQGPRSSSLTGLLGVLRRVTRSQRPPEVTP